MTWASNDFDAALQKGTTFLSYGLRLQLESGEVRAWTRLRRPITLAQLNIPLRPGRVVTVPSTNYSSLGALRVSNLMLSDSANQSDNMEATLTMGAGLSETQVRRGLFDNRPFWIVVFDWKTPVGADGQPRAMLRMRGETGERTIRGREVTWKLRALGHKLRGEILEVTSRDSRARWGDAELAFFDLNGQTADGFPARLNQPIAEVDVAWPRRRFRLAGAAGYPDNRFADGMASFGGANDGFKCGVLLFDPVTGWLTTTRDTPAPLATGQSVQVQIRAPRTLQEWLTFFGNARTFAGEPNIPTAESSNRVR